MHSAGLCVHVGQGIVRDGHTRSVGHGTHLLTFVMVPTATGVPPEIWRRVSERSARMGFLIFMRRADCSRRALASS